MRTAISVLQEIRKMSCPDESDSLNRFTIDEIHMLVADFLDDIEDKDKDADYAGLVELARRDIGLKVRIIFYKDEMIDEIHEFELCSDNLIQMLTKFTANMHRVIIRALNEGARIKTIKEENYRG